MARRGAAAFLFGTLLVLGQALPAFAQGEAQTAPAAHENAPTRYELRLHGETHAGLFRRSLLPGAKGALVTTDTLVPLRQYVVVRARELATDPKSAALDFEVAGWANVWLGDPSPERQASGDVQIANVRYRRGGLSVRAGRQQVAGGAARFVRFDGLAALLELGHGFDAEAYAGFTVLPRWNARPGYHHLGAAVDSELRNPEALPEPDRAGYWLAGVKAGFATDELRTRLSFHEQRENRGLARRNLGLEASGTPLEDLFVGGSGLWDVDGMRLADARVFADLSLVEGVPLALEYLHAEPAQLLSRQSVLSVFGADGYDEAGVAASAELHRSLRVEGSGFAQLYEGGETGARSELAARVVPDAARRSSARLAYARVLAPSNGYHALRASLTRQFLLLLAGTLEAYAYFYDEPIAGRRVSSVYAGTLTYQPSSSLSALLGASLAQSPYARFDAQTQVALSYDFDFSTRRTGR